MTKWLKRSGIPGKFRPVSNYYCKSFVTRGPGAAETRSPLETRKTSEPISQRESETEISFFCVSPATLAVASTTQPQHTYLLYNKKDCNCS